jgi:hypothetical protein
MELGVGDLLTIRVNFRAGGARSSVVFKRDGSRAVFVKAGHATSTRIEVRVPSSLVQFLPSAAGKAKAARWANGAELSRGQYRVQFNPCLPAYRSPTCSTHPPVESSYPPFDAPLRRRRSTVTWPSRSGSCCRADSGYGFLITWSCRAERGRSSRIAGQAGAGASP